MDIGAWLAELGLGQHADTFVENGVDTALLPTLTNEDLRELGILRLGDRKRLLAAAARLAGQDIQPALADVPKALTEGERRQVTVLFADLARFTELASGLDPEELHVLVSRFYERADAIIERYGGTVDKHLGDGVMALFGAPRAHGDDPVRAVRAAFDIHAAVRELGDELGRGLVLHAGIAAGEVVAGGLGRGGRREYTVLGESVNLASRLDGLAGDGETLISDAVQRTVAGHIACEPLGEVKVKGLERPVRAWRATALVEGAPARGGTFVGRRAELRQFAGLLDACRETGAGQSVVVRGEAGIGKTRLVEELMALGESKGFTPHRGLVLDFGVGKGQDAVGMLVRSLLCVANGSAAERAAAVERALAETLLEEDRRAFLLDLLDLPQPEPLRAMYDAMDSAARGRGVQDTLAGLIRGASARRPVLLAVEDVHWADALTLGHLAAIAAALHDGPALLVMTTRIDGDPLDGAWRSAAGNSPLLTFDLGPLRREEALELAGGLAETARQTALRCIERAEGNPLFLEQLLHNAEEAADEAVPGTIQSLVLARMDRLPASDKEALQAAAVIGQRFTLDSLRHLIGDPAYGCAQLIDHHLVRPEGDGYMFSHALIRDGVYSSLLRSRRRALHRQAADWFSTHDPVLRAEHLDRAEHPDAPAAYRDAARALVEYHQYEQAVRLIERGLALSTMPSDRFPLTCLEGEVFNDLGSIEASLAAYSRALAVADTDAARCRAWLGLAAGMRVADRYNEALAVLDRAEAVARRDGLAAELGEVHHLRGNLYFPMGRIGECAAEHEKSLRLARESSNAEAEARALGGLADAHYAAGRMASAFGHFVRCVELARGNGFGRIEVSNRSMIGFSRMYLNQLREALQDGLDVAAAAAKAGHQRAEMLGEILAVLVRYEMAEYSAARAHNARVLTLCRQLGAPRFEAQALLHEAMLARCEGRRDEARTLLERALAISEEVGHGFAGPRIAGELARNLDDAAAKRSFLTDGESMLRTGSVSHNYFYFYATAIDTSLELADREEAERYAAALETFTRAEPLPWSDFVIARGRALAAWSGGRHSAELTSEIERLRAEAEHVGLLTARTALDQALGRL